MRKTFERRLYPYLLVIIIFASIPIDLNAQSDSSFIPKGNPFALIFTNVNYAFNDAGNSKAFELTRGYLGYEYFFSKNISSRINIDIANPGVGELQMTAFIKNAFVQYKNGKISARIGVINTDQFHLQEIHWGYR